MSGNGFIRRGPMAADVFEQQFTQIHNAVFRDNRMSFKAKGIFGLISTHRDGYGLSIESIVACSTDGVAAVRTGLNELEKFGYLVRRQERLDGPTAVRPDRVLHHRHAGRPDHHAPAPCRRPSAKPQLSTVIRKSHHGGGVTKPQVSTVMRFSAGGGTAYGESAA